MAGHSHWANIAHKKAAIDAKRGKVWSKLSRAIIVAAKAGGSDPDTNLKLRYAINDAKAISMPKDNIERAIAKGSGEAGGDNYEEVVYEGQGPSGVMVMVEILTDNRNRTAPEIRKVFEKAGGKLGATGCAAWMFTRKGIITIPADQTDEESLMDIVLEAGADDVSLQGDFFHVTCPVESFNDLCAAVDKAEGLTPDSQSLGYVPNDTVTLSGDDAQKAIKLMEALDDHDDVQKAAANFEVDEATLAAMG
ncbi:YebC/PmpR family DNA-binding transcriptional regulator [Botrimarina mediterranea]|uniref:Probable transcriptional regulatory protein Spa11_37260 n=1 Tax=Botrimarina mediterranea TaxID=2528022 RepID=A0A518KCK4_9BACT|nr:YebC/PmpR family DNA-binding transcriptional regulator [Botrimarina mediterranea]QDV75508.1 putative transcriptional regulatory protein [Botrimarina mediterranea]QDV80141.1 putative transcriptional regulatory protein [Planctomycetes bacterium K2D]